MSTERRVFVQAGRTGPLPSEPKIHPLGGERLAIAAKLTGAAALEEGNNVASIRLQDYAAREHHPTLLFQPGHNRILGS